MEKRIFSKEMASVKTVEVIECPDCAFEFGTIHEQSEMPGLYICPNCQEANLEAVNYHLNKDIKRLRKALEKVMEDQAPIMEGWETTTYEIARQALDGEAHE